MSDVIEVESSKILKEVTDEDLKPVKDYTEFRKQAQLDDKRAQELEAKFTSEPSTIEEYMSAVESAMNEADKSEPNMDRNVSEVAQLRTLIRETYNTSCVPIPFIVSKLKSQGIDDQIQYAIKNIGSQKVADIVGDAKYLWDRSKIAYETVYEFLNSRKEIKSEEDFEKRCDEYISLLPQVYKTEDSPKLYLALVAQQHFLRQDLEWNDIDEQYETIFSDLRDIKVGSENDKSIIEKAGALQGKILKSKMKISDDFNNAREKALGKEYSDKYEKQKSERRKKKKALQEERLRQQEELEREREREYNDELGYDDDDDEDYFDTEELRRQRRNRSRRKRDMYRDLGYTTQNAFDRFLDRHERDKGYRHDRYNPDSNYANRNDHDISIKMSATTKIAVFGIVCFILSIILLGVLKGFIFSCFGLIAIYGLVRMQGGDVPNVGDQNFPPVIVFLIGVVLSIFTLFLQV